ncbi:MAG: WbqC family protein [Arcobacteraceae bacterium]
MKSLAILQSNYIPWKGYFDIIGSVDEFVLYDCVQYTKNDWRNRNKIKTPKGTEWITIPCTFSSSSQKINETKVTNHLWANKHYKTLVQYYSKAKYFKQYESIFRELYKELESEEFLSNINYKFIITINKILGIDTKISKCEDFNLVEGQTVRLVQICKDAGANIYLSGPAAKDYLDEEMFEKENIKVEWMNYGGYKEYEQLYPPFEHGVSILDLIFNVGDEAPKYMKSLNKAKQ